MARRAKFGNRKTTVRGVEYDSAVEARRGFELDILARAGEVTDLQRQVTFDLAVGGFLVCRYVADFRYTDTKTGAVVVEDVKSPITRANREYRLKVKLLYALHRIQVREVMKGGEVQMATLPRRSTPA